MPCIPEGAMLYCNQIQREMRWKDAQGDLLNVRAILK